MWQMGEILQGPPGSVNVSACDAEQKLLQFCTVFKKKPETLLFWLMKVLK
jgi:hypothetical protein